VTIIVAIGFGGRSDYQVRSGKIPDGRSGLPLLSAFSLKIGGMWQRRSGNSATSLAGFLIDRRDVAEMWHE